MLVESNRYSQIAYLILTRCIYSCALQTLRKPTFLFIKIKYRENATINIT